MVQHIIFIQPVQIFGTNAWQWVCLLAEEEHSSGHHGSTEVSNLATSPQN